jgi:hypothetical protein
LLVPALLAAPDTSTIQGFEAAFRGANAIKDFRKLEELVCWERATPKACQAMRTRLRQEFGHSIRRIETFRFSWADGVYPPQNPNLKPTYFFRVWSVSGRDKLGTQITGTFYTLGRKSDRLYFIVSDQPPVATIHYE